MIILKIAHNVSWLAEVGAEFAQNTKIITKHLIMTNHKNIDQKPQFLQTAVGR